MNPEDFRAELREAIDGTPPPHMLARILVGVRTDSRPPGRFSHRAGGLVATIVGLLVVTGLASVIWGLGRPGASRSGPLNGASSSPSNNCSAAAFLGTRYASGLAYDRARRQVILFGGRPEFGPGTVGFCDTWTWSGTRWVKLAPRHTPPPRSFPLMAYDDKNHVVVLYGGGAANADAPRTDTWTWDGTDWTEQHPDVVPGESFGGSMASGAAGAFLVRGDGTTWRWTGVRWNAESGAAPALTNAGLAADAAGWVLFGGGVGLIGPASSRSDTYRLEGTTWRRLNTQPAPGGGYTVLAYDPRRRVILEVGRDGTWTFDGSSWRLAASAEHSPPWEFWGQLAFDESRSEAVYFGVKGGGAGKTWTWDGSSWSTPCTATDPATMTACPFAGPIGTLVTLDGQGCDPGQGSQPAAAYLVFENDVDTGDTAIVGAVDIPSVPVDPAGHFHVTFRIPPQLHPLQGRGGGVLTAGTYRFGSKPPLCGVPFVVTPG